MNDLNKYGEEAMRDKIAFIKDAGLIWTHSTFYGGSNSVILTEEEYNALPRYTKGVIYYIVEPSEDETWTFGQKFPITFSDTTGSTWKFPITLS